MSEFARRSQAAGVTGIGLLAEYSGNRDGRTAFFSSCWFTETWPGIARELYVASPLAVLAACGRAGPGTQPSPGYGIT
ncbi:hypothetical protein [Streptomyces roseifaciens]|uniref:hypothetical protein n=1 Tax=Streptomyces roseifaciens TaxID=1488406 RepID=UPI000718130D|nr:hypothetical protein [Streptomyces roseifaciens]